jgi:hypothetical protein
MSAIYVETSIVGYLTARSASDVVFQARQEFNASLVAESSRGI